MLRAEPDDRFIGSPPLAFTFGLGGLVLFPMRVGASHRSCWRRRRPTSCCRRSPNTRATVCFTAPTAYRAMLAKLGEHDISSLRKCVSAGEALPKATFDAWREATGIKIMDGIGATEMLHIFIGSPERRDPRRLDRQGRARLRGASVIDDEGREVPPGDVGRLAVRGPTGCRYLADSAPARNTCRDGWNITGDTYVHG